MALVVIGGEIYTPAYQSTGNIFIRNGKIESISTDPFSSETHPSLMTIDATGCKVIPGLIDALVHGGGGCSTMTGNVEDLEKVACAHAAHGVTSLVLGVPSAGMEQINAALVGALQEDDRRTWCKLGLPHVGQWILLRLT